MSSLDITGSYVKSVSIREEKFKRALYKLQFMGILLIYPGFFFYHFGVAVGVIPSFLGGYYGVVTGLLFPVLILFFVYGASRKYIQINRMDAVFFLLCLYCLLWSCVYKIFGNGYQGDRDLFVQSISGVLIWITNYILFRRVGIQRRGLFLLLLSGLGMLVIAWANQGGGVFVARRLADSSMQDVVASYQGFSRSVVVILFILMAWITRRWLMPVYYLGLALLFLLSARSEFGGFLVAGFAILIARLGATRFLLLASPALVAGFVVLWDVAYGFSESSRIFRLMDWQADTSLAGRLEMSGRAWRAILDHPFIGDYGSYLIGGGIGDYAHNMLSAWVGFGLAGFVGFSYLLLDSIRASIVAVRVNARDGEANLGFALASFSVILALTAKFMFFPLFAAAWGAAAGLLEARKIRRTHHLVQGN